MQTRAASCGEVQKDEASSAAEPAETGAEENSCPGLKRKLQDMEGVENCGPKFSDTCPDPKPADMEGVENCCPKPPPTAEACPDPTDTEALQNTCDGPGPKHPQTAGACPDPADMEALENTCDGPGSKPHTAEACPDPNLADMEALENTCDGPGPKPQTAEACLDPNPADMEALENTCDCPGPKPQTAEACLDFNRRQGGSQKHLPWPQAPDQTDTLLLLTDEMEDIAEQARARFSAEPIDLEAQPDKLSDGSIRLKRLHCGSQIFVDDTPSKQSNAASPDAKDPSKGACYKDGHVACYMQGPYSLCNACSECSPGLLCFLNLIPSKPESRSL